jgi:hypothetical protein
MLYWLSSWRGRLARPHGGGGINHHAMAGCQCCLHACCRHCWLGCGSCCRVYLRVGCHRSRATHCVLWRAPSAAARPEKGLGAEPSTVHVYAVGMMAVAVVVEQHLCPRAFRKGPSAAVLCVGQLAEQAVSLQLLPSHARQLLSQGAAVTAAIGGCVAASVHALVAFGIAPTLRALWERAGGLLAANAPGHRQTI